MPGPIAFRWSRSVAGDDRARTPVEAPDQLAADRLHVLLGVFETKRGRESGGGNLRERGSFRLIGGEAIFGFPEQARQHVEGVFVTRADEPAAIGLGVLDQGCRS